MAPSGVNSLVLTESCMLPLFRSRILSVALGSA
jgi:hypothetical protein